MSNVVTRFELKAHGPSRTYPHGCARLIWTLQSHHGSEREHELIIPAGELGRLEEALREVRQALWPFQDTLR